MEKNTFGVDALLRLPDVTKLTGRSKWALYADVRAGVFTKAVSLGPRAKGWPASEVAAINRARIAGAGLDDMQALVIELHERRTGGGNSERLFKDSPGTTAHR